MASDKYRLMIYFAHSTMVIYNKSIVSHEKMTVLEFREQNFGVCQRVAEEAKAMFNYELSYEQMNMAAYTYLWSLYKSKSIDEVEAHVLSHS